MKNKSTGSQGLSPKPGVASFLTFKTGQVTSILVKCTEIMLMKYFLQYLMQSSHPVTGRYHY